MLLVYNMGRGYDNDDDDVTENLAILTWNI